MKKFLLVIILCLSAFQLSAQNRVEFLGTPLAGSTKSEFAEKLLEKSYQYKAEQDGYVMYVGQFIGIDASIMLVPADNEDGLRAIYVSIDELSPIKMGQLYAELLQKFMAKYADYKYTTTTKPNGSTEILFRKVMSDGLLDVVSLKNSISNKNCSLSITYATGLSPDDSESANGIGMEDI